MRPYLGILLLVTACGGAATNTTPPPPPPPPPPPAPVATVSVLPQASSVLATDHPTFTVTTKDAAGTTLTGRTVTWAVNPAGLATIATSSPGTALLTPVAFGTVTVTATSEGVTGNSTLTIVDPRNIPFFDTPFTGTYEVGNLLDHNIPKEFVDNNGTFTPFWGEVHTQTGGMTDGHSGYDFLMPTGTPLLSVGPGTVSRVDLSSQSFFCPPLGHNVSDQMSVYIDHQLPGGVKVRSWYVHISRADVTVGQVVTAGQQVALSGNTGCSSAPHLHFEVFRVGTGNTVTTIDPYGWSGSGTDPWETQPDGSISIQLWKSGKAPLLERIVRYDINSTAPFSPLVMTKVVYEGPNDAVNPNNEYTELTLDTRMAATLLLDGYGIIPMDQGGQQYLFPAGITLTAANPTVRVYTGSGTNSGLTLYMGRSSGVWANNSDKLCGRVKYPAGQSAMYFHTTCP